MKPLREEPSFACASPRTTTTARSWPTWREHGWHAVSIEADDEGPGYVFPVGLLYSHGFPELVVRGLPAKVAHGLLWNLVRARLAGLDPEPLEPIEDVASGFPLVLVSVGEEHFEPYLGDGRRFYRQPVLPAEQLVWPDKAGRFPWQPGYEARFDALQPFLASAEIRALIEQARTAGDGAE